MNLIKFDLERLEVLPIKCKFSEHISTKLQVVRETGWKRYYRNNKHKNSYTVSRRIIRASVGKKYDEILSRIVKKFKEARVPTTYRYDIPVSVMDRQCARIIETSKGKRMFDDGTLYVIKQTRPIIWQWRYDDYYFDEENVLHFAPRTIRQRSDNNAKWYRLQRLKQKQQSLISRRRSLTSIKLINKPVIYKFYHDLLSTFDRYEKKLVEKPKDEPKFERPKEYNYETKQRELISFERARRLYHCAKVNWRYDCKMLVKDKVEATQKIGKVEDKIRAIESGDYTSFYNSQTYLYSIGKECPHMESPQKQITCL